jgi:Cdc6-like AAA superfamily ATPase
MSEFNEVSPQDTADMMEFVEASKKYKPPVEAPALNGAQPTTTKSKKQKDEAPDPGSVTQYSLHGPGFRATTTTIPHLEPGCYDIIADNICVFATPALKQSGILLELPEMRSEEIIRLSDTFWNSEKDYKEGNEFVIGGAAFKSGIMVYGPPGSGKSCTLKLVSNKLVDRGGIVFYASTHPANVTGFLNDFARIENERKSIIILEDFDSLIKNYGDSAYLAMLDSPSSIDNVLFIATTNYPERLDPRIYNRPGRFSHVVKIGLPGPKTRDAYLRAILKNHRDVDEIVEKSQGFTIDHLSALVNAVYREKKNLQKELARLKILFEPPKVDERTLGFGINAETEE